MTIERQILGGNIEGKRRKGRPKGNWKYTVEENLHMVIGDAGQLAHDINAHRKYIQAAKSPGKFILQK